MTTSPQKDKKREETWCPRLVFAIMSKAAVFKFSAATKKIAAVASTLHAPIPNFLFHSPARLCPWIHALRFDRSSPPIPKNKQSCQEPHQQQV